MKSVVMEKGNKIAALKEDFKSSRQLFDVYSDIVKTYMDITKEDYVSQLIKVQQEMEKNASLPKHKPAKL